MDRIKFYVDLDAILDTRAALLFSLGKGEVLKKLLIEKRYHTRIADDFPGVDRKVFSDAYKNRTKHLLRDAMATGIHVMLREFVTGILRNNIDTINKFDPIIVVNSFPYVLNEKESDILTRAIAVQLGEICDVQLISLSDNELTPSLIKKEFCALCRYDYMEWLELHSRNENFRKTTCPDIALYVPQMFLWKVPSKREIDEMIEKGDPFSIMEESSAPIIKLAHIPVLTYSIDIRSVLESHSSSGTKSL